MIKQDLNYSSKKLFDLLQQIFKVLTFANIYVCTHALYWVFFFLFLVQLHS